MAFSWETARSAARGSNPGPDRMIALPWDVAARFPITIPKQWYSSGAGEPCGTWRHGARQYPCEYQGPGGQSDLAFQIPAFAAGAYRASGVAPCVDPAGQDGCARHTRRGQQLRGAR
ncbi:hypothetical protein KVA01_16590 [Kocuria varians]|uniref:Uncharacterized protein n=1 Tax=Kocuria varians TaxID=1272 RepID=A0A4Y4D716_KOCVA|nr:hypothetical protein KVA01_16590 [Kocuria varians]